MALISLNNIKKTYKMGKTEVEALKGVTLNIEKGDFICVTGPSGAGKSTLLHIAGCIEHASTGNVMIHGENIGDMSDRKLSRFRNRHIGFIFQNFNLLPVLNVYENIEYPLVIRGEKIKREKILEMIDAVGLSAHMNHRPDELSGGQRQRVAIARALIAEPDIIIADEPTANLDSTTGEAIVNLLLKLNREKKTSFLMSTHNESIAKIAGRKITILDGKIIEGIKNENR